MKRLCKIVKFRPSKRQHNPSSSGLGSAKVVSGEKNASQTMHKPGSGQTRQAAEHLVVWLVEIQGKLSDITRILWEYFSHGLIL